MDLFRTLFGSEPEKIKPDCIICPGNDAHLFIKKEGQSSKGLLFSANQIDNSTIISTKNSFLIGDCVLNLKNTPCKRIFLFGSCGGISPTNIGDKLLIEKSFILESFTKMLSEHRPAELSFPDDHLFDSLKRYSANKGVLTGTCATVSSIELEQKFTPWFRNNFIRAIDMESSIIFSAAKSIKVKAAALLYCTDMPETGSPFSGRTKNHKDKILSARKSLSEFLITFIHENRS